MFTGLVEETGIVTEVKEAGEGKRVTVEADWAATDVSIGDSISVSGACLTVEGFDEESLSFFLAEETLDRTWFSELEEGDELNFERSLTPRDRMGGHYVQGHVDSVSEIGEIEELEEGWNFTFSIPEKISQYIVEKGFVTVEGISLTVTEVSEDYFSVTIIPETWEATNLSEKEEGDHVNIEADIMAKYVEKMA
ncbi:MAG: riboflavin synthase [Candidatus Nanohalobium sp.]